MVSGIVVLVLGILLIALAFTGVVGAGTFEEVDISDLEQTEDETGVEYDDYEEGDVVVLTGEIRQKEEDPDMEFWDMDYDYSFELEDGDGIDADTVGFFSDQDVGDVGDEVTVTLEVHEERIEVFGETFDVEYMVLEQEGEPFSFLGITFFGLLGIMVAVIGAVIAVLGAVKEDPSYYHRPSRGGPNHPAAQGSRQQGLNQQGQQQRQQPDQRTQQGQQQRQQPDQRTQQGQQQRQQPDQRTQQGQQQRQQPDQRTQQGQQQRQNQVHPCPDCGRPIRYIQEYDSWYCDSCQEYK